MDAFLEQLPGRRLHGQDPVCGRYGSAAFCQTSVRCCSRTGRVWPPRIQAPRALGILRALAGPIPFGKGARFFAYQITQLMPFDASSRASHSLSLSARDHVLTRQETLPRATVRQIQGSLPPAQTACTPSSQSSTRHMGACRRSTVRESPFKLWPAAVAGEVQDDPQGS